MRLIIRAHFDYLIPYLALTFSGGIMDSEGFCQVVEFDPFSADFFCLLEIYMLTNHGLLFVWLFSNFELSFILVKVKITGENGGKDLIVGLFGVLSKMGS